MNKSPADLAIEKILSSPCASNWLKQALRDLSKRDCVDAYDDSKILDNLMVMRMNEVFAGK